MVLLTKTVVPVEDQSGLGRRRFSYSPKSTVQAFLFCVCIIVLFFIYLNSSTVSSIKSWSELTKHINSSRAELVISESSKWQSLSGNIFCSINSRNFELEKLKAVHKTWLRQCDNSQIYIYQSSLKSGALSYRSIFSALKDIQQADYWQILYSFVYSYEISKHFDWYLNAQIDSFLFIRHLNRRLTRFNSRKLFVFVSQTRNSQDGLIIMSNGALNLLVTSLTNKDVCPSNPKAIQGFKDCMLSLGIEVYDEKPLRLHFLDYEAAKINDNFENELTSDLVGIYGIEYNMMYLINLLMDEKARRHENCTCN